MQQFILTRGTAFGGHSDVNCLYFERRVMLKLGKRASQSWAYRLRVSAFVRMFLFFIFVRSVSKGKRNVKL